MKHLKLFEEFQIHNSDNTSKLQIGDLVWAKDMGMRGLVGLVVSEPIQDADDITVYDIYYRGLKGDVIETPEVEIKDIIEADELFNAESNGDLMHYPNIAKKLNITINPKYQQYLTDVQEENM
jgi:hypothetical protein